ncbi:MAG: hypothetical protein IKI50_01085 [Clostridia bacterium]|nr:hypothetical protein [Clostridia bacterium]
MHVLSRIRPWLLPLFLVLFIAEMLLLPLVLSMTYADRPDNPHHLLTYQNNRLTWDEDTRVNNKGVAELTLFDAVYQHVHSDDGAKVLAPGTEGDNLVRLKNGSDGTVTYTAVLYRIKSASILPVSARLDGDGYDVVNAPTPDGVNGESIVRAVAGELKAGQIADFAIDWYWLFEESATQDEIDTALGDAAAAGDAEDIIVGLYITIDDDGTIHTPETGYSPLVLEYVTLMVISAAVLILLLFSRRREKKEEDTKAAPHA